MNPADMIAAAVPPRAPKPPAAKSKSKSSDKYPEFEVPSSYSPPADAEPNQDFQAVATFRLKDNGKMCLVAVDGSPIGDKEPDATDANEPAENEPSDSGEPGSPMMGSSMAQG